MQYEFFHRIAVWTIDPQDRLVLFPATGSAILDVTGLLAEQCVLPRATARAWRAGIQYTLAIFGNPRQLTRQPPRRAEHRGKNFFRPAERLRKRLHRHLIKRCLAVAEPGV